MDAALQKKTFPAIHILKKGKSVELLAGLNLDFILKSDLLVDNIHSAEDQAGIGNYVNPKRLQKNREAFLNAVSSWPLCLCLELHFFSLPDLVHRSKGRIWISLFFRVKATSKELAVEEVYSRYIALLPLLGAYFPEAEFSPIVEEHELLRRWKPFQATHGLSICRKSEQLSLAAPLQKVSMGYGPVTVKTDGESYLINHKFPWAPSFDDWYNLVDILKGQLDPIQIVVRIGPKSASSKTILRLSENIKICERFVAGIPDHQLSLKRQANRILDISIKQQSCLKEKGFRVGVYILATHPIDSSIGNAVGISMIASYQTAEDYNLFQGGYSISGIKASAALRMDFFSDTEIFTAAEAACVFRLPSPPLHEQPGLPVKRYRTSYALAAQNCAATQDEKSIRLFINAHRGGIQPIHIGADDRMRHLFVLGQTGTGKSTFMQNMILQDMRAGRGLALIDPHGELVDDLLGCVPPERADDVILFDLLDRRRPLGFNIIEWKTLEERDFIIDELYLTIDRLYDMKTTGGPLFETNFRGILKLLMGERPRKEFIPTLLEFTSCYLADDFRKWLISKAQDPQTLDFVKELERTGGEASLANIAPYITSKINRFVSDITLMRIIGQEKTSIDFDSIMDEGKILLVKLGKGRFGPMISALLANQIVSRFKMAAMKRGETPPEKRRDFFLYVDECHNLPHENFMELLSEARKYRMGLILATQYMAQIESPFNPNNLLSAILGNVGTIVIFRLGQDDAIKLSPLLYPQFSAMDICGLPNWCGYSRLQANNEAVPPMSFKTEKDMTPYDHKISEQIRNMSSEKYGTDIHLVDKQIRNRRHFWRK